MLVSLVSILSVDNLKLVVIGVVEKTSSGDGDEDSMTKLEGFWFSSEMFVWILTVGSAIGDIGDLIGSFLNSGLSLMNNEWIK